VSSLPTFTIDPSFLLELYQMREKPPVSVWAEENIFFSTKVSPFPGFFRVETAPYMKLMLDVFGWDHVEKINYWTGSQIAKTTTMMIQQAFTMEFDPSPMIFYLAEESQVNYTATERLRPILDECKPVAGLIDAEESKDRRKASDYTIRYPGGSLVLKTAASEAARKSIPAKYGFYDEVDMYKPGALKEALERLSESFEQMDVEFEVIEIV